jgi:hypothetical protein
MCHNIIEHPFLLIQFTAFLFHCKIRGFHGGDYEEWYLLGCYAVWLVVPSSPILVTLMMEAPSSSETLVLTRATQRNIQEDVILLVSLFGNLGVTCMCVLS